MSKRSEIEKAIETLSSNRKQWAKLYKAADESYGPEDEVTRFYFNKWQVALKAETQAWKLVQSL